MEVVLTALGIWALPLALMYAGAWGLRRRRRSAPHVKIQPASAADPRYMKDHPSTRDNGGAH
jgi:hypothetical protein